MNLTVGCCSETFFYSFSYFKSALRLHQSINQPVIDQQIKYSVQKGDIHTMYLLTNEIRKKLKNKQLSA